MALKILLILPKDRTYQYKGSFTKGISYAPLTLSVLAALVPKELEADCTLVDEGVQPPILEGVFDIVAVTCVTSSAIRAYELCRYWKAKGSHTVLGGVHPTMLPEEAKLKADTIFCGLAERTFPKFIYDFIAGQAKDRYEAEPLKGNLPMPVPRRDLLNKNYMNIPTVVANRGCANHCSYCSIPSLWGCEGLTRPIGEVIDEIKNLNKKRIILLDPSPTSDRDYAMALFTALKDLKIRWSGLSTIDVVEDEDLFQAMVASGCEGVLAGFETINEMNLMSVGKQTNKISGYKKAVAQFHRFGIPVLGCFVTGFDHDTKEGLLDTLDLIDDIGIDLPRFSILTPFPGTPLYRKMDKEGRIKTKNWDLYDTMHVVFDPKRISQSDLQLVFYDLWKEAYSLKRIGRRLSHTKRGQFIKLAANLGFRHYAGRMISEK